MNSSFYIKDIWNSLNSKQKIGISVGFVVLVMLAVVAGVYISNKGDDGLSDNREQGADIVSGTYINKDGQTVAVDTHTNTQGQAVRVETWKENDDETVTMKKYVDANGNKVEIKIFYDKDGNITSIEKDGAYAISTMYNDRHNYTLEEYLPYGEYWFLSGEESDENYRIKYYIDENSAIDYGIIVSVDSCDVEGYKAAANEYLKTIPMDLSDYIVVYKTHTSDLPCNIP